jgi:hypothetical protein
MFQDNMNIIIIIAIIIIVIILILYNIMNYRESFQICNNCDKVYKIPYDSIYNPFIMPGNNKPIYVNKCDGCNSYANECNGVCTKKCGNLCAGSRLGSYDYMRPQYTTYGDYVYPDAQINDYKLAENVIPKNASNFFNLTEGDQKVKV